MKQDEIKIEVSKACAQIKQSQQRLESLRSQCLHTNTFDGVYSYKTGLLEPAVICSDCGALIRYKKN